MRMLTIQSMTISNLIYKDRKQIYVSVTLQPLNQLQFQTSHLEN
jgi:hypothetical protein